MHPMMNWASSACSVFFVIVGLSRGRYSNLEVERELMLPAGTPGNTWKYALKSSIRSHVEAGIIKQTNSIMLFVGKSLAGFP